MTLYNKIGEGYNHTRRADPFITSELLKLLEPLPQGNYLDIGCGTGNYLEAFTKKGLLFYGADPSEKMLAEARLKISGDRLICSAAEKLPFDSNSFDGCTAVLTLHHWQNLDAGLSEICRVLKTGAKFVMFSFCPEQMRGYWLHHYFPRMIEESGRQLPHRTEMAERLTQAGFKKTEMHPYFIKSDLSDHFLYSYKFEPARYLDPQVRQNISSFRTFCSVDELNNGIQKLEQDITSGEFDKIQKNYSNNLGDYLFISSQK
mgnify:CR=1 FL=1